MVAETHIINGIIAAFSFISNGLLCIIILRKREMLKSSYNILIFTLAITDTLTGIFLLVSPTFVLGPENVPVPPGTAGNLFCRIINRGFFVWVFAKFSVSLVTCMAIERWFAIARPNFYKVNFTRRRVYTYIALMFIWNFGWVSQILFEGKMEVIEGVPKCVFKQLIDNKAMAQVLVVMYCALTTFVPMLITLATYVHLRFVVIKQMKFIDQTTAQRKRTQLETKLMRMSAVVAMAIGILFLPNQVAYILTKFDVYSYDEPINLQLVVLAMCNSWVNPWIYCFTNRSYRDDFLKLLCPCRRNRVSVLSKEANTMSTISTTMPTFTMYSPSSKPVPREDIFSHPNLATVVD